jgi:prepilin-type N-terminal cleavage/methylation domain-containing protein
MDLRTNQQGITLVELLIVMLILGLILAGVYGMLSSAQDTYLRTRALVESQQTSRVVMNYLTYRLREMDGGGSGTLGLDPRNCTECHVRNLDDNSFRNDSSIPCVEDVLIPRRNLFLDNLTSLSGTDLPDLAGVDPMYKLPSGFNSITFSADLLPVTGLSDTFTDSPVGNTNRNGRWDLTYDDNNNTLYDPGEDREILYYDLNDNGHFDYYPENWTLKLRKPANREYYELVESLSFGIYSSVNQSAYSNSGYTDEPVAYGITGLDIQPIPQYVNQADFNAKHGGSAGTVVTACAQSGCHTSYGGTGNFNFTHFVATHPWWNVQAFHLELVTTDPVGRKFIRTQQYIIPRNLEVNAEK